MGGSGLEEAPTSVEVDPGPRRTERPVPAPPLPPLVLLQGPGVL